jgi:hypothetical protein
MMTYEIINSPDSAHFPGRKVLGYLTTIIEDQFSAQRLALAGRLVSNQLRNANDA